MVDPSQTVVGLVDTVGTSGLLQEGAHTLATPGLAKTGKPLIVILALVVHADQFDPMLLSVFTSHKIKEAPPPSG